MLSFAIKFVFSKLAQFNQLINFDSQKHSEFQNVGHETLMVILPICEWFVVILYGVSLLYVPEMQLSLIA